MKVGGKRQIHIFLSKRTVSYVVLEVETVEEKKLKFPSWKTVIDVVFLYDSGMKQKNIFLSMSSVIYVVFKLEPVQQIKLIIPLWNIGINKTYISIMEYCHLCGVFL